MASKFPINKRLKEARLEVGLSQKQLGIAAEMDEFVASARMNQYETGKHVPNFAVVQKIAKVTKMPVSYFYTPDNELAGLIKLYGKLNEKRRQQLGVFIKQLSEE